MTLILRKLLASSTFAISNTLDGLARKLEEAAAAAQPVIATPDEAARDVDELEELTDEWGEEDEEEKPPQRVLAPDELSELQREMAQLREFQALAQSIVKNSKGEVLLTALRRGFAAAADAQREQGAATLQQKAVIFTESRRTQDYLFRLLEETEFKGKVMLFNGSNTDPLSKSIYETWLKQNAGTDKVSGSPTADKRAALVEHFRNDAAILLATEAAAEGINLQFCNLIVNYDLPWNPQRIEQRIGRCHRYGQKFDVVVVNFLNKANAADQRVYELLDEKFKLFNGVFGASDEVLGAVESGVDFEKRIAAIYQKCRTPEQISFEFDQLQSDLEADISANQQDAREKLLDNFDQEVIEKVKLQTADYLDRFNDRLWRLTCHTLRAYADFEDEGFGFRLHSNPFPGEVIHPGPYRMGKAVEDANTYRVGHPLAQRVLDSAKAIPTASAEVTFDLGGSGRRISILEPLLGASGWLTLKRLSVSALETEDYLLFAGVTDGGETIDDDQCRRLFDLNATAGESIDPAAQVEALEGAVAARRALVLEHLASRNGEWFDAEMDKLDRWAEDRRTSLKAELTEIDETLKVQRKAARQAPTLPEKLERQREMRKLEAKRDEVWRAFDAASRDLDRQKDTVLDEIARRLEQQTEDETLFTIRWKLV